METLLREIEQQLAGMTPLEREQTAQGLQQIIQAGKALGVLKLSKGTAMRAMQVMVIGMAGNKGMSSHLVDAQKLAPKIGRHVNALVQALS